MTGSPTTDGSGRSLAKVVVVLALVTVCPVVPELGPNVELPVYDAVSVFAPLVVEVRLHE